MIKHHIESLSLLGYDKDCLELMNYFLELYNSIIKFEVKSNYFEQESSDYK